MILELQIHWCSVQIFDYLCIYKANSQFRFLVEIAFLNTYQETKYWHTTDPTGPYYEKQDETIFLLVIKLLENSSRKNKKYFSIYRKKMYAIILVQFQE